MPPPIETRSLHKTYGPVHAVTDLSFVLPPEAICGFLGPNGAGKSSTIRMILGLTRPDQGEVFLFGQALARTRSEAMRRTGAMIEQPAPYPNLTGRENLEIRRRLLDLPSASIQEALEIVRLAGAADRRAGGYSTGMKRRLSLASALLGRPALLILDEPTNGLDVEGIAEFRELIKQLPAQFGMSVLLASHHLSEVQEVATHVMVLVGGKLRFQSSVTEMAAAADTRLALRVSDCDIAAGLLRREGFSVSMVGADLMVTANTELNPARINTMLNGAGLEISHMALQKPRLEDIYMKLTRTVDHV